ncbi:molybdopterin-guanine dinucleotide biosynthesis protein MobA [Thermococcus chitonophagus]|uniref:Molybdopterin-guanine dinucleotide biosynthesis protein MobA n=1 Tax=Thermococcus chitonophagus TaxID=54262 RepID=A0A160VQE7_9EURY|nr:molybdenum cofactor guanylyltransferase [Thermococcus chitonophagus]ASJ15732.1 molybdopterin-guanine dinucleotide biosynthesis protein MobA [Thermococcus chitonophagus]CUX76952.1 Molybdopterin-guanine dinucleotide biosynthesis protein MobA [Thermococcus chitonophagus]
MLGVIFAVKLRKTDNYLIPINDEPMVKIIEERLRQAKRVEDVITLVKKGQERKYSLHVSNVRPVKGKTVVDALLEGLPPGGDIFLIKGDKPLVMPFLINYMTSLYLEEFLDALIPRWKNGEAEVFHAVYNVRALRNALGGMKAEGEKDIRKLPEYIDAEFLEIEELMKKNEKVWWSFFTVKTSEDLRKVLLSGLV